MHPDLFHLASGPAEFVITGVWQGLLITGAAWMGLKALPKLAPRTRFLLWMAVFLLAALLPFAGLLAWPGAAPLPAHAAEIPAAHLSAGWALALASLWALASLFALARLALQGYELHRLARTSTEPPPESFPRELRSLLEHGLPLRHGTLKQPWKQSAKHLGLEQPSLRPIALRLSQHLDSPMVLGFFHPLIVVPEWLWQRLTPSQASQVVMHEIAHLKRRDDWTNLLQKFLRALFPLNPALLWAERQLYREREMACDDAVLEAAVAPREYAASLASLAEKRLLRRAQSLAPGAWRRRSELALRVHRILQGHCGESAFRTRPAVAAFLAVFLSCGALLARSPRIVTFLPPPFPAALASNASALSLPARSASLSGPLSSPRARFEPASLRMTVPQTTVPESAVQARKAKRRLDSALRRRSHRRAEPRALDPLEMHEQGGLASSTASTQPEAIQPGIVLAVWEISPPLSLLSDSGFSYSSIAAFRSNDGWIIFQL